MRSNGWSWLSSGALLGLGVIILVTAGGTTGFLTGVAFLCFGVSLAWFTDNHRRATRAAAEEAVQQRLLNAQDIGRLLVGSGAEFEESARAVLATHGYALNRVGRTGDRGVDLLGTDPMGSTVIVQCKRYGPDNKVSSPAVQSFLGAIVNQGAASGIFITTSTYTRDARLLAEQSRVPIWLIDGATFASMARTIESNTVGHK